MTTLQEQANGQYRSIANYEQDVVPLLIRLDNIDWHKVLVLYSVHWQNEFIDGLEFSFKEDKGRWRSSFPYYKTLKDGRRTRQDRKIQLGQRRLDGTYSNKPCLPIPLPADLAQRQLREAKDFYLKELAAKNAEEKAAAPDARKYLASRLKNISQQLTNSIDTVVGKLEVETRRYDFMGMPQPKWVGQVLAEVEYFKQCHREFCAAEQFDQYKTLIPAPSELPLVKRPDGNLFRPGFTVDDADKVAHAIYLINEAGDYIGKRGLAAGRLCGFYYQLKQAGKVNGNLEELRDYFAARYLKHAITTKPNTKTNVAQDIATDTKNVLKRLFPIKNQG